MLIRNIFLFSVVLLKIHNYAGCDDNSAKKSGKSPGEITHLPFAYDLSEPTRIELPKELNEISGIVYYPKDTSIFSIVDEDGLFYKTYLNRNNQSKVWRFDKKHDFEDLVLQDSTFYILVSNGDIDKVKFYADSISLIKSKFPDADKKINEFEALYYDEQAKKLVMICKNCEEDKEDKKQVTACGISLDSLQYSPDLYHINVQPVAEKLGVEKLHLKPSAAAFNPVTKDLYVLASVNKLLLIFDQKGQFKDVFKLDALMFKQPEGLAFTPQGDMIISNEAGKNGGSANILIFKYKKQ